VVGIVTTGLEKFKINTEYVRRTVCIRVAGIGDVPRAVVNTVMNILISEKT
jgi:hypothetical protein